MLKTFFIIVQVIIYIVLYVKGKSIQNKSISKKELSEKGLWWVITTGTGFLIFHKIKSCIKNSSRERMNISRFNELFGVNGFSYYEVSRASQLSLLLILLIAVQMIFFYIRLDMSSLLFGGSLIGGVLIIPDKIVENLCIKRRTAIENNMPEFLNRLAILVDAGLTVKTSLQRIVNSSHKSVLYVELKSLLHHLDAGMGEDFSFEEFARRCNTSTATSFAAVVLQNIKKGNKELSTILRIFAKSCWDTRMMNARKRGEEAAAKLMMPMMIIFIGIMILLAAPAIFKLSF